MDEALHQQEAMQHAVFVQVSNQISMGMAELANGITERMSTLVSSLERPVMHQPRATQGPVAQSDFLQHAYAIKPRPHAARQHDYSPRVYALDGSSKTISPGRYWQDHTVNRVKPPVDQPKPSFMNAAPRYDAVVYPKTDEAYAGAATRRPWAPVPFC